MSSKFGLDQKVLVTGRDQSPAPFLNFTSRDFVLTWVRQCGIFASMFAGEFFLVTFFVVLIIELSNWRRCANTMCFPCMLIELLHSRGDINEI